MTQIFTQDKNRPVPLEEQIVLLYALKSPALQEMDVSGWKRFKVEIYPFLLETRASLIQEIGTEQQMTKQIQEQLDQAYGEYLELHGSREVSS